MSEKDDPLEIPAFLRRQPDAARKAVGDEMKPATVKPAAKKSVARQDVPQLRELGYSEEDIAEMDPREAEYIVYRKRQKGE